jgi:RND family efflux transporter MFP subunit
VNDDVRSLGASEAAGPHTTTPPQRTAASASGVKRIAMLAVPTVAVLIGSLALWHVTSGAGATARAPAAKPVTFATAAAKPFQPSRTYVGTFEPWLSANVGPQFVSAYVDTVEVRPGAVVKRGDVLARLDCRDTVAGNDTLAMQARAIDARQKALAAESARLQDLLAKNFVSPNEAQMKAAASAAEAARLRAQQAKLSRSSLEVGDCVLRAPFDGEVATRTMDPGAFVRPGMAIASVVDRSTVRFSTDVPEVDFHALSPGTPVTIFIGATAQQLTAAISRRAPAADPSTRTVHFEVDLPDPERRVPVGTTGEARLAIGAPLAATVIPLACASVRGERATVFVIEGDIARAHTVSMLGEGGGSLFVDPALAAGAQVVLEGAALLTDGDKVSTKPDRQTATAASSNSASRVAPVEAPVPPATQEHRP